MFFSIKSGGPRVTKDRRFGAACNRVTEPFQRPVASMICRDSEQRFVPCFVGDLSQIWERFATCFRSLQRPVAGMICCDSEQLLATRCAGDLSQIWKLFATRFRSLQRLFSTAICGSGSRVPGRVQEAPVFIKTLVQILLPANPCGEPWQAIFSAESLSFKPSAKIVSMPRSMADFACIVAGKGVSDGSFDARKSNDFCCQKARNSYEICDPKRQFSYEKCA